MYGGAANRQTNVTRATTNVTTSGYGSSTHLRDYDAQA